MRSRRQTRSDGRLPSPLASALPLVLALDPPPNLQHGRGLDTVLPLLRRLPPRRALMSPRPCTNDPCSDLGCYTHGDPIWEATVHGELDPPEEEMDWYPGEE